MEDLNRTHRRSTFHEGFELAGGNPSMFEYIPHRHHGHHRHHRHHVHHGHHGHLHGMHHFGHHHGHLHGMHYGMHHSGHTPVVHHHVIVVHHSTSPFGSGWLSELETFLNSHEFQRGLGDVISYGADDLMGGHHHYSNGMTTAPPYPDTDPSGMHHGYIYPYGMDDMGGMNTGVYVDPTTFEEYPAAR